MCSKFIKHELVGFKRVPDPLPTCQAENPDCPRPEVKVVDIPGPSRKLKGTWPKDFTGPSPLNPYPDFPVTGDEND